MTSENQHNLQGAPVVSGLLAEFDSPGALITAAEKVRDAGYTQWDTHSPYPVHGIDEAMGIRRTRLPWIVFIAGLTGCALGLALQWWANAAHPGHYPGVPTSLQGYDFLVSGKPKFSLPANIPVVFEVTVLLSAIGAFLAMLVMNDLPRHHTPLLAHPRFSRVTRDRFYLCIDARDPEFDATQTRALLQTLGGLAIEPVSDVPTTRRLPTSVTIAAVVIGGLALLPPLMVAKARVAKSEQPRVQLIRDMGKQEKFRPQRPSGAFADGRAMRPLVTGTVARGELREDPHYYEGKVDGQFATTFPPQVEITVPLVRRGQQRFNIYCAVCHGLGGAGDGIVQQRALALNPMGWVQPANLTARVTRERADGYIFDKITNGVRTMPPYGDQVPVADRWAIVYYVRALQVSQNARLGDVPEELRGELR